MGPSQYGMAPPQIAGGGTTLSKEGSCEYIEEQSRTADKGYSSNLGFWRGANNSLH